MKKFISLKKPKFLTPGTRGFNLFSSVVAAVLVMSAVVLINTLISTEEKTTNQVYLMVNSFELSDAASLARADALQSFNYFFRERMETWLTCQYDKCSTTISTGTIQEDGFNILTMENYTEWQDIVDTFQSVVLYSDPKSANNFDSVIRFIAEETVDRFNTSSYGRYTVSLSDNSEDAKEALKNAISQALQKANANNKNFVEVVNCDDAFGCPVGTFYFNVDLSQIDNDVYEKLPRIIIRDTLSGEEMKTAILPRSNLKIYIPLRFFKVIYEARKQAARIDDISANELENAQLGFCGNGCAPNSDPNSTNDATIWNKQCALSAGLETQDLVGAELLRISTYDPGGSQGATNGLNSFTRSVICNANGGTGDIDERGFSNYNFFNGGLIPVLGGEVAVTNCPFESIYITPKSFASKNVEGSTQPLYCMGIRGVEASIIYEETNPEYIVSGAKLLYKITITTSYPNSANGSINGTCINNYSAKTCNLK